MRWCFLGTVHSRSTETTASVSLCTHLIFSTCACELLLPVNSFTIADLCIVLYCSYICNWIATWLTEAISFFITTCVFMNVLKYWLAKLHRPLSAFETDAIFSIFLKTTGETLVGKVEYFFSGPFIGLAKDNRSRTWADFWVFKRQSAPQWVRSAMASIFDSSTPKQ